MNEVTLESLARRVEALERALDLRPPPTDPNAWRRVVGMFDGSDFMRQVDEEGRKNPRSGARPGSAGAGGGMILLDTDHLTLLKYPNNERGVRLNAKMRTQPPDEVVAVSIISVEEQMRGWLAAIAKERQILSQILVPKLRLGTQVGEAPLRVWPSRGTRSRASRPCVPKRSLGTRRTRRHHQSVVTSTRPGCPA